MQGTSRTELAAELERCARLTEETARHAVDSRGDRDLVSSLLLAAAALDAAARAVDDEATQATALLIAATLVRDAIGAAERHGPDERLLGSVTAWRHVAGLCEGAVGD